jgi:dTDP-4-amino-4,6-dideoxygalactose transaminase
MLKNISFIDLSAQQKRLEDKLKLRIEGVLSHGKYIMGPEVSELEKKLENYTNAKYAISCGSGSDALLLSMLSYGIGPGDAVFCPSFTFPATAEAIALVGATPIFVDVDLDTFNISVDDLEKVIINIKKENKYKLSMILAVDLYGLPANYDILKLIADENNMVLLADAAQSFGAEYNSQKVGKLADTTCISFFPAKPLGCYGDGGAVITDDIVIAEKIKSLRLHGKGKSKYDIDYVGINSRLDTIQAAILLEKLDSFDWEVSMRNKIADKYTDNLSKLIKTPDINNKYLSVWAQYTLRHKNRDLLQKGLAQKGIPTMVYYPVPMHRQNAYKKYNYNNRSLPNSDMLSNEVFSIPIYPDMHNDDQDYIITEILNLI